MLETIKEMYSDVKKHCLPWSIVAFCICVLLVVETVIAGDYGEALAYFLATVVAFNVLSTEILGGLEKEGNKLREKFIRLQDEQIKAQEALIQSQREVIAKQEEVIKTQDTL